MVMGMRGMTGEEEGKGLITNHMNPRGAPQTIAREETKQSCEMEFLELLCYF